MHITATELKNNLGQYITASVKEPVVVEKSGKPTVVVISYDDFQKYTEFEDLIWGFRAEIASREGFLGVEETHKLLLSCANKAELTLESL